MEPPGATAEWTQGRHSASPTLTPTTKLESVASRLGTSAPQDSAGKHPGCTWPPEKAGQQRSEMVAAWQGHGDLARIREPHVGGVPRSVLQRLLAMPSGSATGTAIHSPRRRCSAASAAVAAMVHSPRAFASSDRSPLKKRDPTAQTMPYQCCSRMFPTPEFGSYESSSNCSSRCSSPIPVSPFTDHFIPSDDEQGEDEEEVVMLRQQLQAQIRGNGHEDENDMDSGTGGMVSATMGLASTRENEPLENNQVRRWSAPVDEDEGVDSSDCGCSRKQVDTSGEAAAKLQLTRLRARMHAIVIDSQRETHKREKQLTLETTIKVAALEQKHATATTRLAQQATSNAAQVEKLQAEKQELLACMQAQQERLKQLELALGGKQIVDSSR
ncbi:unnamed protein product [Phytophthora lilii]|uniref:Unnamed protein product n=1 Tax=Phytophthora lilii TaxID=2077276 RepID=A0A9W6YK91_9STRA|nr:unnamed protein product [Phytophthora lilii]